MKRLVSPAAFVFVAALLLALWVGARVAPTYVIEQHSLDVQRNEEGQLFYVFQDKPRYIEDPVPMAEAELSPANVTALNESGELPETTMQVAYTEQETDAGVERTYYQLTAKKHWRFWSLLPAVVAVVLCWITREPLTALFGGIVVGAFILGQYDITDDVLVTTLMTRDAAGVLLLYLWLLGGLMGIWSRTGAAQAFAVAMTKHVVRGPRSAKFVAWMLGIVFFQGGSISTVLVGTTVKPLADDQKISHEELSYIVDSTASPVAGLLAFNAWPGYVQAFLFVPGVTFLATEADRISFFFRSLPFSFYCIFALIGTFLLCVDKAPVLGGQFRRAIDRAKTTGELDAPDAKPLSARELQVPTVPEGYKPHVIDFFLPLFTLIAIAVGTFIFMGTPQVRWAFGAAVLVAFCLAIGRGMSMHNVMEGYVQGLKGVVFGAIILLLAIAVGMVSRETGAGIYLVDLLGDKLQYWALPVLLQILTVIIAFSTGTSWGTYAVTFPLAMPLALAVGQTHGVENIEIFMMICFAAVLNGSIIGDQCSPISDTTVLSSMCTGCDLMDHVKTQMVPASVASLLAAVCWTASAFIFA